jgi:predicted RND superfamily exporter protein
LTSLADRAFAALARAQAKRPAFVLLIALVLAACVLLPARSLALRTDLTALLPEDDPTATQLELVLRELGVGSRLDVVLESGSQGGARACGDALAERIRMLGARITSAQSGMREAHAFLLRRALLFATTEELERTRDELAARRGRAVAAAFFGDLDDEPPPVIDLAPIRAATASSRGWSRRFPDGYFESEDGKGLVVVVTSSIATADLARTGPLLRSIRRTIDEALGADACRDVRVGYAGDMLTAFESYRIVRDDLLGVGALGVGLVLVVVLLFFARVRALLAMALSISVGLAFTFAFARMAIGHINVATGFLVSIVAGNGLNVGIILGFRLLEEARREAPAAVAIERASVGTWRATLGAAAASSVAYASLGVTGFRAFVEFGAIGAAGMLSCWAATHVVLPPVFALCDRVVPFRVDRSTWFRALRTEGLPLGRAVAAAVTRRRRGLAAGVLFVVVLGIGFGVRHSSRGLVDRDLRRIRSDLVVDPGRARVISRASEILGDAMDSPVLVRARTEEEVPEIERALRQRRAALGASAPIGEVHALADLVPVDQSAKLPLVAAIRNEVLSARRAHAISDSDYRELEPMLPPEDLVPYTAADLPDDVLPGTRRDARARVVVVGRAAGSSDYDLDDLTRLADALDGIHLDDGTTVLGTGRPIVFAELLRRTFRGLPRALVVSLLATIAVVVLTLRRARPSALVAMALGVGLSGMALGMALGDLRLNLFSVIAIPVAFGIGADYALNLVYRAVMVDAGDFASALSNVGSAVILCSATTALGYAALLASVNPAIKSFGALSVLGEVACLAAAIVVPLVVTGSARTSSFGSSGSRGSRSDGTSLP